MADIELVIKIPKEDYQFLKEGYSHLNIKEHLIDTRDNRCYIAIAKGTPLPKGHGDLKDFEKLYADMSEREEFARQRVIDTQSNRLCYTRYVAQLKLDERTSFKEMLYDAPTIIEADKESEE